jgi:hypothetical protein
MIFFFSFLFFFAKKFGLVADVGTAAAEEELAHSITTLFAGQTEGPIPTSAP